MPSRYFWLAIWLVSGTWLAAADEVRDHDVTIDDYFTQAFIADVAVSPDGKQVVYIDARWEPPRETRNADLWVVSTAGGTPRRLTFEFGGESSPQWSPEGKYIYYQAGRKRDDGKYPPENGKPQVWRHAIESGDVLPVTRVEEGVAAFRISDNGKAVYYTVSKDAREGKWKALQEKYSKLDYGHGKHLKSELWKVDLESWRSEKLLDAGRYIHDFAVSHSGRKVAMISTPDEHLISLEGWSQIDVHDLDTNKTATLKDELWRKQAPSPFGWLESLAWSHDDARLAFTVAFDGYPAEIIVTQWNGAEAQSWKLARPDDSYVEGGRLMWAYNSPDLYFLGDWHSRKRVYRIKNVDGGNQGATDIVTPRDVVVSAFSVASDADKVVVVKSDPANTEDVFAIEGTGRAASYRKLTDVNPQMRKWKLPSLRLVSWKGANGDTVEGLLELPPGYEPGKERLPLILEIHGGPTSATPYCLRYWIYGDLLMAARGYARLSPNYRGSVGYGDKFLVDLVGRENDIEVKDLIAGVDAMIEQGIADPDKLGVMGWSNGGFLTNAVVGADQRFKAASSGAGVLDQFLQWGLEDTPGHVINFMGAKLPWESPEAYRKGSPAYQLGQVKTPMLIHVGANDARVPAAHSRTLHRALYRYLNVDSQLVMYPGEEHSLGKRENRRAKMEWDQAWFDHYLRGKPLSGAGEK
jgi:dipeptidyl aminopeptidase/acylaminoacyl peptidase